MRPEASGGRAPPRRLADIVDRAGDGHLRMIFSTGPHISARSQPTRSPLEVQRACIAGAMIRSTNLSAIGAEQPIPRATSTGRPLPSPLSIRPGSALFAPLHKCLAVTLRRID